jgi:two-component system, chemotaxis family, chemotaxis protein CheY
MTTVPVSLISLLHSTPYPEAISESKRRGEVKPGEPNLLLLIEDDFVLRGALAEALQGEGYKVECAANALDALRRLNRPPKPSLVLLDIMLPHMDGLEFRSVQLTIREIADIPIVVISAIGVRPEVADELDLHQTFSKPIDMPKLLATIRRYCTPSVS